MIEIITLLLIFGTVVEGFITLPSVPRITHSTGVLFMSRIELTEFLNTNFPNDEVNNPIISITKASIEIAASIASAPINGLTGTAGTENTSGDKVKKLDVISNEILINELSHINNNIRIIISEEEENPILLNTNLTRNGIIVAFDPLDGSSNLDCAVATGTIFGIYKQPDSSASDILTIESATKQALQCGTQLLAGGYIMYSSSIELMLTLGQGTGNTQPIIHSNLPDLT